MAAVGGMDMLGTTEKCGLAFLLGMILNAGVNIWIFKSGNEYIQYQENKELLAHCEKELPRNEECILMAVPASKLKLKGE